MRNPLYRRLIWNVLTLGPVGTALPAPGTWGSACAALAVFVLQAHVPDALLTRLLLLWGIGGLIALAGTVILRRVTRPGLHVDHPSIVLDEVAGMLVAAAPGGLWASGTFVHLTIAFVLFRLFDIFKPFGIRAVDRRGTPGSVFLDDIYAGGCAAAGLALLTLLMR